MIAYKDGRQLTSVCYAIIPSCLLGVTDNEDDVTQSAEPACDEYVTGRIIITSEACSPGVIIVIAADGLYKRDMFREFMGTSRTQTHEPIG